MIHPSILHTLERAAGERPGHACLIDLAGEVTYRELLVQVSTVTAWLADIGLRRRQRVGIHLPKTREEVVATVAVGAARGVFVNLNYQWTSDQVLFVSDDCDIDILITDQRRANQLLEEGRAGRFQHMLVVGEAPETRMTAWSSLVGLSARLEMPIGSDLAALLYTSGSSGTPKGGMVTHGQLQRGAEIVSHYLGMGANERVLSVPPLSFDYGLNQLTSVLLHQATLCLQKVPIASEIVKSARRWNVTGLPLVAPSWVQVSRYLESAKETLEGLRYLTNTGGAIPTDVLDLLPKLFPGADIFLMYGLTEAFRSTFLPPALYPTKRGAIGRAIPNVEIFVVDPQRGICGPNETGELVHRGDLISLGYWRREVDTLERIRSNHHLGDLIGDEKVVHSGDLVRYDDDGVLWFLGRADGMIKTSGYRVSPTEVELAASKVEGVGSAVAFGVADHELGQRIHLVVESEDPALKEVDIIGVLRTLLPSYMVPMQVFVQLTAFPRTSSGKIDRQSVIDAVRNRSGYGP